MIPYEPAIVIPVPATELDAVDAFGRNIWELESSVTDMRQPSSQGE